MGAREGVQAALAGVRPRCGERSQPTVKRQPVPGLLCGQCGGADSRPWGLEFGTGQAGASLVGRAPCGFSHALHRNSASRVTPEEDSEAEPGLLWTWPRAPSLTLLLSLK